jgi:hypothetical protein
MTSSLSLNMVFSLSLPLSLNIPSSSPFSCKLSDMYSWLSVDAQSLLLHCMFACSLYYFNY